MDKFTHHKYIDTNMLAHMNNHMYTQNKQKKTQPNKEITSASTQGIWNIDTKYALKICKHLAKKSKKFPLLYFFPTITILADFGRQPSFKQ